MWLSQLRRLAMTDDNKRYYQDTFGDDVRMPIHTIGECRYSKKCKQMYTDLGDGLCIACYDGKTWTRVNKISIKTPAYVLP